MNSWGTRPLGELARIVGGGTPTRNTPDFYGGTIPWVTPKDMKSWDIDRAQVNITQKGLENSAARLVPENSVLVVVRSGVLKHSLPVAVNRLPVAINQDMKALVCDGDLDADFLARFIKSQSFVILRWVRATTADNFPVDKLKELEVPLPPIAEQRRIAQALGRVEMLRTKRRSALAQLETLIQAIFLDMFGDPVTNPKGWPRIPLADAYWYQEGPGVRTWQFRTEGVKLLNVGNIEKDGSLNLGKTNRYLAEEEAFGRYRHFLVDPGDLVIASSGVPFDDDGLLRTRGAFVSEADLPLCMNTSTIRFKAVDGVSDLRFLWVWLNGIEFRRQITKVVTGTAQQNFGPSHLSSLLITLPPVDLQREFARRVASMDTVKTIQHSALGELDALFASLQDRAFREGL